LGYVEEEAYPILQGRELYLPKRAIKSKHSVSFNQLKLSLRDYHKSFNEIRCENFDIIATYRPYHSNEEDFGLYLYAEMFCMLVLTVLQRTNMSLRDSHKLALDSVLTHGSFHYLFERYSTLADTFLPLTTRRYLNYRENIYSKIWGTPKCVEETLANLFIYKVYSNWTKSQKKMIEFFITRQRDGYCQALEMRKEDYQFLYNQLEIQLQGSELKNNTSQSMKVSKMPKLLEYIERNMPFRFIGLPIYLVNDCQKPEDFERIVETLFPQL
jgi:hypothetical protein